MSKKIVFTGGLSSGKTTTINMLRDLGHLVMAENSELAINNYKQKCNCYPWENKKDLVNFHQEVLAKQMEIEKNIKDGIVFLDRGVPDRLVFMKLDGLQVPPEVMGKARLCNYYQVFYFEGDRSIYEKASHRPQDMEYSKIVEKLTMEMYRDLGYSPIIVPFCSREERLKFILEKVV